MTFHAPRLHLRNGIEPSVDIVVGGAVLLRNERGGSAFIVDLHIFVYDLLDLGNIAIHNETV